MRASLVGMGCLALLLLPAAAALSVTPDELTATVRQGQVILFHIRGAANDSVTISTDHIGPQGIAVTVPLGGASLDANGTMDFPLRIVGDLAAVGRWQLRVSNATVVTKVFYEVDWDPLFLLQQEAENLARMEAFWARIEVYVLSISIALMLTWILMRVWHAWNHVRPAYLGKRIAAVFGRLRVLGSVTEMGLQVADSNPDFLNRAAFFSHRRKQRGRDRVILEDLDRLRGRLRERRADLEAQAAYRDRVLANNPGDPLVTVSVEDPIELEKAVRATYEELWPKEDDGAG